MNKLYSMLLIAMMAMPITVFASDATLNGSTEIAVRGVAIDNDSGRFNEFQNTDDGVVNSATINAQNGGRYLDLEVRYAGQDDETVELEGGKYGQYKYSLFLNEMPHNYSYNNRSFYSGIGSGTLTYAATDNTVSGVPATFTANVPTDASQWNSFDYGIVRKKYGAGIEADLAAPFYVKVSVRQEETSGIKPTGVASGVYGTFTTANFSPFGQLVELPEPVDYENTILQVSSGYSTRKTFVELAGFLSTFENNNDLLTWRNPYVTNQELNETSVLAPDSDYYKLSAKAALKQLPMDSVLALKASVAQMESDIPLLSGIWAGDNTPTFDGGAPIYTFTTLGLNQANFDGDITTTKGSVALSSKPSKKLSSKIYYEYFDKDNSSSHIIYTNQASLNTIENHLFEYEKQRAGFDLAYKLTAKNKLSGGYEYKTVDRHREDFDSTSDHKVFVKLKNTSLDTVTFNLKLQYLDRSADFVQPDLGGDASILLYQKRHDAADKVQTMAKVGVEFYPSDNLDLGLEYRYKFNDYDETVLGLTEDVRHEIYADASYRVADVVSLNTYAGYEMTNRESQHRQYSFGGNPDPSSLPTAAEFNWSQELEGEYWDLGILAEMPIIRNKLSAVLSYNYQESDGANEFTTQGTTSLEDVEAVEDYDLQQVEAKCLYTYSDNLDVTLGYRYEKLDYEDAQYENYSNFKAGAFDSYFLTGAYADNDYEANVSYLALNYIF